MTYKSFLLCLSCCVYSGPTTLCSVHTPLQFSLSLSDREHSVYVTVSVTMCSSHPCVSSPLGRQKLRLATHIHAFSNFLFYQYFPPSSFSKEPHFSHFSYQITCILPSLFTLSPGSSIFTSLTLPSKLSQIRLFVPCYFLPYCSSSPSPNHGDSLSHFTF